MPSQTLTLNCQDGPDVIGSGAGVVATGTDKISKAYVTDGTLTVDQHFTGGSLLYANLQSLAIDYRDSSGNYLGCTVETNAADHTGGDILTLTAGAGPLIWKKGCGIANPLAHDITGGYYVTPTTAVVGTLRIMATFN